MCIKIQDEYIDSDVLGGGLESWMMNCQMKSVNQIMSHPNTQGCQGSCLLTGTKGGG